MRIQVSFHLPLNSSPATDSRDNQDTRIPRAKLAPSYALALPTVDPIIVLGGESTNSHLTPVNLLFHYSFRSNHG